MKVLKICLSEWLNEGRDKRELSVCRELGAEVLVLAKGEEGDQLAHDSVAGFDLVRLTTRPLGTRVPNALNRLISIFTWAKAAASLDADVITGHDVIGLLVGWLANRRRPKRKRAALVYDAHEFEPGRAVARSKLATAFTMRLERFLMKRCAFSIVVNDTIADELTRIYRLSERPVVIRSTPPLWQLDSDEIMAVRRELCARLKAPDDAFIVMYHGMVMPPRKVETLIEAVADNPDIWGVVLGTISPEAYRSRLTELAEELGVSDRMLFIPAVPIDQLYKYAGAVDLSEIILQSSYRSYYYALPNKLFESIQSLTPIVASDFPELRRIVGGYGIGLLVDPANKAAIGAAIERMRTDREFYSQCKRNLLAAKEELCWEREKQKLAESYSRLIKRDCRH